jgi:hypothetical protein
MKWTEVHPCVGGGAQWEAYPNDTHAIDIWLHEKEGFSWCVITDDVDANAPEGWSPTVEDAKRHAEQAYEEWVEEHDETADIVAEAVAQERAAVVAYLRRAAWWDCDDCGFDGKKLVEAIELRLHRAGEGA